jgi:hypothetical protein
MGTLLSLHAREFHLEIMVGEFGYNTQSVKEVQLFDLQGEPDSRGSQMIISMIYWLGSCSAALSPAIIF